MMNILLRFYTTITYNIHILWMPVRHIDNEVNSQYSQWPWLNRECSKNLETSLESWGCDLAVLLSVIAFFLSCWSNTKVAWGGDGSTILSLCSQAWDGEILSMSNVSELTHNTHRLSLKYVYFKMTFCSTGHLAKARLSRLSSSSLESTF